LPPSPTFTDLSSTRFGGSGESDGIRVAKETKLVAERKLLFIREQMEHHKYVLTSYVTIMMRNRWQRKNK
jgi:hypothetical protein